jgi:hypothetical protein
MVTTRLLAVLLLPLDGAKPILFTLDTSKLLPKHDLSRATR